MIVIYIIFCVLFLKINYNPLFINLFTIKKLSNLAFNIKSL